MYSASTVGDLERFTHGVAFVLRRLCPATRGADLRYRFLGGSVLRSERISPLRPRASRMSSVLHPAWHLRTTARFFPRATLSDGFVSGCAGQVQPVPVRVLPAVRKASSTRSNADVLGLRFLLDIVLYPETRVTPVLCCGSTLTSWRALPCARRRLRSTPRRADRARYRTGRQRRHAGHGLDRRPQDIQLPPGRR